MKSTNLKVASARDIGPLFQDNPHRMVGQDGAYPIPLSEEETLWFFGDTLIGEREPGESLWFPGGERIGPEDMSGKHGIDKMLTNTALICREKTGANGISDYEYVCDAQGNPRQLIPLLPEEEQDNIRIWCQHGCQIKDRLYLFFLKVTMVEEGPLAVNFEINGAGLAVGARTDWRFSRVHVDGSSLLWKANDPKFGACVYVDEDSGWVYIYGVINTDSLQKCYVARVQSDRLDDMKSYEYLISDEPKWEPNLQKAVPIFSRMPHEMSVSYNDYLGCYLAVHSLDLTGWIVGRTAPDPWGPWSEPVNLWKVEHRYEKPLPYPPQVYAGKEHPELAGDGGRILYLTYIEFEEYYPHLVEVTLGPAQR